MNMKKSAVWFSLVFSLFLVCFATKKVSAQCLIAEMVPVQFVCPDTGEAYEVNVMICPGRRVQINVGVCRFCRHQHRYPINYWPEDYWRVRYVFWGGWFFPHDYWVRHWPYYQHGYRPGGTLRPPPRPPRGPAPPQRIFRDRVGQRPIQPPPPRMRVPDRSVPNSPRSRVITPPPPPAQRGQPAPPTRSGPPQRRPPDRRPPNPA